jgi:hypothetical protein
MKSVTPFSMFYVASHGVHMPMSPQWRTVFRRMRPLYPDGALQSAYQGFEERMDRRAYQGEPLREQAPAVWSAVTTSPCNAIRHHQWQMLCMTCVSRVGVSCGQDVGMGCVQRSHIAFYAREYFIL